MYLGGVGGEGVQWSADEGVHDSLNVGVDLFGESEICDLEDAVVDHDVRGLDVAVDDAELEEGANAEEEAFEDLHGFGFRELPRELGVRSTSCA